MDDALVECPGATVPAAGNACRVFSVEDVGFFEGTEKLLEIWFSLSKQCRNTNGLRGIPRKEWDRLLEVAHCRILSVKSNDKMDAYLLSESSMFICDTRFILKTCGTTTLMNSVNPLLSLVEKYLPGTVVTDVFYSHQKFKKPDLQFQPHHSFSDECNHLDSIFKDGSAYILGKINGECWYLYIVECIPEAVPCPDQTLEIMMMEFDPKLLAQFSTASFPSAEALDKAMGIDTIIPGSLLDSHVFDPCGYSANAIIKDDYYYSIHVTPQDGCSYVSFETNILSDSYTGLVKKILGIFRPRKFSVTVFANEEAECGWSYQAVKDKCLTGWTCKDKQFSIFSQYNVTFWQFVTNNK